MASTELRPEDGDYISSEHQRKLEKRRVWKYRLRLIVGLFLPFLLDALDTTLVATALPHIASHFNQLPQQGWIVTAFTLTNTAFIPAFGQLSNVFGRHTMLQTALVLMWVGSALCTAAQSFEMLLVGRAIVGMSSAGLLVMTTVILADKVSLEEQAFQNTIFSIVAGSSYAIGPVIGGYLTSVNWRWCFGIALPISALAHLVVFVLLRPELVKAQPLHIYSSDGNLLSSRPRTLREKISVVDWPGLAIFIIAAILFTLAVLWGGSTYPWTSAAVLAPMISGIVLLVIFIAYEHFVAKDPLIPTSLFTNTKDFPLLAYINFSSGATIYAMFYFVSIYYAVVEFYDPSQAGIQLLYFLPGLGAGSYLSMYMCTTWPRETFPPLALGNLALPIALGILSTALDAGNKKLTTGMTILTGFGVGACFMPNTLHAMAQIADREKETATAVATIQLFEPLGGTIATALMASVLNNNVAKSAGEGAVGSLRMLMEVGEGVGPGAEVFREAVRQGVKWAFVAITPVVGIAALCALALGVVEIDGKKGVPEEKEVAKPKRWAAVEWAKIIAFWLLTS